MRVIILRDEGVVDILKSKHLMKELLGVGCLMF